MATVQIPFAGGSYKSLSLPYSAQTTKNLFFEVRQNSRSVAALHGFPGLKAFASTNGQADRGMCVHNNALYKVSGSTLYAISSGGVATSIGTITGTYMCGMVSDGNYLVITTGGTAYTYDGTTLAAISDSDLESPYTVTYNNSRVIYDGADRRFCVADVGQPSQIDGLNYATAEAFPGSILAVKAHKQYVYMFCSGHIEPWYNSGVGSPPYDRVNGGILQVGLGARYSVCADENYLYFLGSDRVPRRLSGISAQILGNSGLANEFREYEIEDARGFCFSLQGDNFYCLTFPTANKTWLFQESIGEWLQLTGDVNDSRHRANSYAHCYDKHLMADWENGQVYELDFETYTDAGNYINRERTTQPLHAGIMSPSLEGKTVFMSRLELILEAGVGLSSGQGVTPQVMLQFSDDGGFTWSSELWQPAGVMGARQWRVQWFNLGRFISRMYRFRMTDPVKVAWLSCNADIEVGI